MAPLLNNEQLAKAKSYVFRHGRLLDRQLFNYFFGDGTQQACINALFAYQNPDGGFGNGIEPDILCPDSTMIGAETAMYTLELLDCHDSKHINGLVGWITNNQNMHGTIDHPPKNLFNFPHQPWWESPDKERILALAGILKKWGYDNTSFFTRVSKFFQETNLPEGDIYYSYTILIYLKYCNSGSADQAKLALLLERLPGMLQEKRDYFPLVNRLWFHADDYVSKDVLAQAATDVAGALQEDGGLTNPYVDLPWWRPIHTVDSLVLLKKMGYL